VKVKCVLKTQYLLKAVLILIEAYIPGNFAIFIGPYWKTIFSYSGKTIITYLITKNEVYSEQSGI